VDALNEKIGRLVAVLVLLMVLLGAFNALARYLSRFTEMQLASNAYIEGQWYLFSLVFLLGAAYTLKRDQHVRVDVFYGRLSERGKAWIDLGGTLFFLLPFCAFALWASWPTVESSWVVREVSPDPGGLPRYPIKAMILACFALLFLQGVSEAIKRAADLFGPNRLPHHAKAQA
jgi:TRAP-type mannitol/chloroaromatic compound transport system permease small subunit